MVCQDLEIHSVLVVKPPEFYGRFSYPARGPVQPLNLIKFYYFGAKMAELEHLVTDHDRLGEYIWSELGSVQEWLSHYWNEMGELPLSRRHREAVTYLQHQVGFARGRMLKEIQAHQSTKLTVADNTSIMYGLRDLEREFEYDSMRLGVFGVTRKGDRDITILIEDASQKFDPHLLAVMPQKTTDDIKEAGACLAFERPTACAFHICRATEALMLAYYEKLAGAPWPYPQRDWANYNNHLIKLKAPERITTRLEEIRKMERNAYAHLI